MLSAAVVAAEPIASEVIRSSFAPGFLEKSCRPMIPVISAVIGTSELRRICDRRWFWPIWVK